LVKSTPGAADVDDDDGEDDDDADDAFEEAGDDTGDVLFAGIKGCNNESGTSLSS